jgi:hypothetical protein
MINIVIVLYLPITMERFFALMLVPLLFTGCFKKDESNVNVPCTSGCAVFNITVTTGNNAALLSATRMWI